LIVTGTVVVDVVAAADGAAGFVELLEHAVRVADAKTRDQRA
jgi:hypothetical protein